MLWTPLVWSARALVLPRAAPEVEASAELAKLLKATCLPATEAEARGPMPVKGVRQGEMQKCEQEGHSCGCRCAASHACLGRR